MNFSKKNLLKSESTLSFLEFLVIDLPSNHLDAQLSLLLISPTFNLGFGQALGLTPQLSQSWGKYFDSEFIGIVRTSDPFLALIRAFGS